jgi:hypothetical protein
MPPPKTRRLRTSPLGQQVLPVSGFRDTELRITYLPWSDPVLGLVGWELIPDRGHRDRALLVYVYPVAAGGRGLEVRCHLADDEPNPETDQLLGMVTIPADLLGAE